MFFSRESWLVASWRLRSTPPSTSSIDSASTWNCKVRMGVYARLGKARCPGSLGLISKLPGSSDFFVSKILKLVTDFYANCPSKFTFVSDPIRSFFLVFLPVWLLYELRPRGLCELPGLEHPGKYSCLRLRWSGHKNVIWTFSSQLNFFLKFLNHK